MISGNPYRVALVILVVLLSEGCLAFFPRLDPFTEYGVTGARFMGGSSEEAVFSFRGSTDSTQHLYIIDLQTSEVRPLTSGERFDTNPLPSPDSTSILFTSKSNMADKPRSPQQLFILTPDDGALRKLSPLESDEWHATWSSTGNRIAFVSQYAIFLIRPDGTELTQLTERVSGSFFPKFCLDDTSIFYWKSQRFGNASPMAAPAYHDFTPRLIDYNSLVMTELPFNEPAYSIQSSAVLSDGSTALWHDSWQTPSGVRLLELKPPNGRSVFTPEGPKFRKRLKHGRVVVTNIGFAVPSPNDSEVLFAIRQPYEKGVPRGVDLYIHNIKTEKTRQVASTKVSIGEANFSADGNWILARTAKTIRFNVTEFGLALIRSDGSYLRHIPISLSSNEHEPASLLE